ncbi:MAG: ABC transporter permease [Chitinophagaceae bacterium]
MFKLSVITAWRSLLKNKFYTGINIVGLSVASAAFFLLANYVRFERSYENMIPQADNIYRITLDLYEGSQFVVTDCETYPPMGPLLKQKYPEVTGFVRAQDMGDQELTFEQKAFRSERIYCADPSVLDVFNVVILKGDKASALSAPGKIIISSTIASRLFGNTDPVGKTIMVAGSPNIVTGVMQDAPANTHLKFDVLMPISTLAQRGYNLETWSGNNNYLYLQMKPGTDLTAFNAKLAEFSKERLKEEVATAELMKDIHLHSNKTFEPDVNGDARSVNILAGIALLVLFIGSANYVNLATARSAEKRKESGLRKVLGSSRFSLVLLFFIESILINLAAIGLALVLTWLALPFYNRLVGDAVANDLMNLPGVLLIPVAVFAMNVLLSGLYPAFVLSSVKAAVVTNRNFTDGTGGTFFRKALVVGQFTIALIVLSASLIVYQQLSFVRTRDLGMNIEQVLVVRGPALAGNDSARQIAGVHFRDQLLRFPGVKAVSMASSLPGLGLSTLNTNSSIRRFESAKKKGFNYYLYGVDESFLDVMSMKLVAGRNFETNAASNDHKLLINEEASRLLGFKNPSDAIGRKISMDTGNENEYSTVVGVIGDYHQQSLKEAQIPMIHWFQQDASNFFAVRMDTRNVQSTLDAISTSWQSEFSGHVFDYYFMNEMFNKQYAGDVRFGRILNLFAGFTLLITILGLLGLATYNASRRTREIGIRKVLGASTAGIIRLLSRDFLRLVLLAILLAIPICWYITNAWLQGFNYRISINWWVFVVTGLVVALFAVTTIGIQGLKTAMANPVKSLRSE